MLLARKELNMHVKLSSGAWESNPWPELHLLSYFVYANTEGSGKVAYVHEQLPRYG